MRELHLEQCFSNFHVRRNHMMIFLKVDCDLIDLTLGIFYIPLFSTNVMGSTLNSKTLV